MEVLIQDSGECKETLSCHVDSLCVGFRTGESEQADELIFHICLFIPGTECRTEGGVMRCE